jgi:hypothetical protein
MAAFETGNTTDLIRTNVWQRQLKQLLLDDLMAMKFIKHLTDFPDGTTLNIPVLGEAETADFSEGQRIKYNKMDTGNFTFSFDQYKYSANSISAKFMRDSFYAADVLAAFVPRQHRAIMEAVEARILSRGPVGQTASDLNLINGAKHRWVAQGSSNKISTADFIDAQYALTKANVPLTNLVAILDPSAAVQLQKSANVSNYLSPMPMWEDVVRNGMMSGFKFRYNFSGFDVYVSNYLPDGYSETINSVAVTNGVANQFFSAAPGDTLPIIGGFREMPNVQSDWNKDSQEWEYFTITEYGFKLYRPENMVVVLSDKTALS